MGDLSNERSRSRELAEKIARRGPIDVNKVTDTNMCKATVKSLLNKDCECMQ